jgi:hypothetical protein
MDEETAHTDEQNPSDKGAAPECSNHEYIKTLIEWARDDTRQDYLRVTGALAVVTLFITQIRIGDLQELDHWPKLALFAGLACLVAAAFVYFLYVNGTHRKRWYVTKCMRTGNAAEAERILGDYYERFTWLHRAGSTLFALGTVLLAYVIEALVA